MTTLNPTDREALKKALVVLETLSESITADMREMDGLPFADYADGDDDHYDTLKFTLKEVKTNRAMLTDLLDQLGSKSKRKAEYDLYTPVDVSDMTIDELFAIRKEWHKLGENVVHNCTEIAKQLGEYNNKKHGHYMIWNYDNLNIKYDSHNGYTYIRLDNSQVGSYTGSRSIYKFVPGAWVHIIDEYYPQAQALKLKAELERDEKKRRDLARELGG